VPAAQQAPSTPVLKLKEEVRDQLMPVHKPLAAQRAPSTLVRKPLAAQPALLTTPRVVAKVQRKVAAVRTLIQLKVAIRKVHKRE
jgi:hypothetical protein